MSVYLGSKFLYKHTSLIKDNAVRREKYPSITPGSGYYARVLCSECLFVQRYSIAARVCHS